MASTQTWGISAALFNVLEALSKQNKLSGIPAGVLASIIYTEGRTPGLPTYGGSPPNIAVTNSDGTFQGWYDLQPGASYTNASGQTFTMSPQYMDNTSTQAFTYQSEAAAAALSGYMASGMNLSQALEHYSGSPNAYNWYTQSGHVPGAAAPPPNTPSTQGSTTVVGPNPLGIGGAPNSQAPSIITGDVKSGLTSLGQDITNPITSELGSIASDWSDRIIGGLEIAGGLIIMLAGIFLLVKEESAKALVSGLTGATRGATSPAPAAEALLPEPPEAPEAVSEPVEASGDILPGGEEEEEPPDLPVTGGPPEEVLSGETLPSGADLDDLLDAAFAEGYWKGQGEPPPSSAARDAARRAGEAEPMNAGILVDALDLADLEAF